MTLAAWPLVRREDLVRGFRPGSGADAESPFRTLRRKHSVTAGIAVVVHAGGRIAAKYQVYSSLNFDSARLARQDRWDEAHAVELAADRLESGPEMGELVALLRHLPLEVTEAYMAGRLPERSQYPLLWHLTTVLAQHTTTSRASLLSREDAGRTGVLEPGQGEAAVITMTAGDIVSVPRVMTSGIGLGTAGSVVTLFSEVTTAGQLLMDVLPGFRLTDGEGEPRFDPYAHTNEPLIIPTGALNAHGQTRAQMAVTVPIVG